MTDLLVLAQLLEVPVLVADHLDDLLLHLARNPELGLQQAAESSVASYLPRNATECYSPAQNVALLRVRQAVGGREGGEQVECLRLEYCYL